MPSITKTSSCADISILALPSAYQEYLVTFGRIFSNMCEEADIVLLNSRRKPYANVEEIVKQEPETHKRRKTQL